MLNESTDVVGLTRWQRISSWAKKHPFMIGVGILGLLFAEQIATLPFGAVSELATRNPAVTAFMEERAHTLQQQGRKFRKLQGWVSINDIPRDVINAVIVSEDGTFWSHHGFDWYELRESVERNFAEGRAARGASTISQQLVKNLFLSSSKNPLRKLREWILTFWLEAKVKKTRILEIYLNVIEWGDGVYGVEAASLYHFGKTVDMLNKVEAARLAAIIPSPRNYLADSDAPYVVRRSELILERMAARGY